MDTDGDKKTPEVRFHRYLKLFNLALLGFLSFSWLILVQVEYELVRNPDLRDDIIGISEDQLVYGLGVILIGMMLSMILLSLNIKDLLDEILRAFVSRMRDGRG